MKIKIALFFIIAFTVNLYAEAFFAGSANSVNSDSGFNALRNPALMSGQKKDSAGFSYFYSYNAFTNNSGKITAGAVELEMDSDYKEKLNGNMSVSFVKKFDYSSLGFGIRKVEGTDQMLISETSSETTYGAVLVSNGKNDNKSFGVSTVFSYSKDLGRDESVGIQFEIGTSTSTVKKSTYDVSPLKNYNIEITTDKLIGNLNCGYRFVSDKYEIGAILKFGEYTYEKQKYSYEDNIAPFNKSDKKVSPYIYRNKGFESTLGLGYNITRKLLFDIEATLAFPYYVKKKELKDDDGGVFEDKNNKSYTNISGNANVGFSYNYSRNLNLGFGGGTAVYRADSTGSNGIKYGNGNYNVYSFLAGAEIKPTEGVSLLFGLNSYYIKQSAKFDSGSYTLKLVVDALYLNAILGASMSY